MTASPAQQPALQRFEFVREWDDDFLALFPHRGDYLWAEHPEPGKRPSWHTESKHLLSDRLIKQGAYLYGVRFGTITKYLMLDIDARSPYHPRRDTFAIGRILEALEPIGLVSYVAISSSYSNGIHLYFSFKDALPSWKIALAAKTLLENKGFKLQGGQLELFPNPKPYSDQPLNYNGHRLPLQQGSYLLNEDWEPTFTTQRAFAQQWRFSENRNAIVLSELDRIVQSVQRKTYKKIKVDGQKYLNDLTNDIEQGWTSTGQTQFILGKIANRERVFYHALHGGRPLEGKALAERIVEVACSLPGYQDYCGHKHEIEKLAECWARAAERRYYPYGFDKKLVDEPPEPSPKEPTWNERQSQEARERIRNAIADLLEQEILPAQATARRHLLKTYRIANTTLDRNRDLWHPDHLKPLQNKQYHPVESNLDELKSLESLSGNQYQPINPNKLCSDSVSAPSARETGDTSDTAVGGSGGFSTGRESEEDAAQSLQNSSNLSNCETTKSGPAFIQGILKRLAKLRLMQRSQSTLSSDPPPDEHYFGANKYRQLELPDQVGLSTPVDPTLSSSSSSISTNDLSNNSSINSSNYDSNVVKLQSFNDISDIIIAIQIEIARIAWSAAQVRAWIAAHFNGKSRWQLTNEELLQLLQQLWEL